MNPFPPPHHHKCTDILLLCHYRHVILIPGPTHNAIMNTHPIQMGDISHPRLVIKPFPATNSGRLCSLPFVLAPAVLAGCLHSALDIASVRSLATSGPHSGSVRCPKPPTTRAFHQRRRDGRAGRLFRRPCMGAGAWMGAREG